MTERYHLFDDNGCGGLRYLGYYTREEMEEMDRIFRGLEKDVSFNEYGNYGENNPPLPFDVQEDG